MVKGLNKSTTKANRPIDNFDKESYMAGFRAGCAKGHSWADGKGLRRP